MRALLLMSLLVTPILADTTKVMAEPNLERRSQAALLLASETLSASRKAYNAGELDKVGPLLDEVEKAVVLAEASLKDSGKDPNKSPKYFKSAEIKTGELLRRLDGFAQDMNFADRPMTEKVKETVQQIHDRILLSIMTKKKK